MKKGVLCRFCVWNPSGQTFQNFAALPTHLITIKAHDT